MKSELQIEYTSTYIHTQPKYDVVEWVIKRRSNHTLLLRTLKLLIDNGYISSV